MSSLNDQSDWRHASKNYLSLAADPTPSGWLKHVANCIGFAHIAASSVELWWSRWTCCIKDWKAEECTKDEYLRRVSVVAMFSGKASTTFSATYAEASFDHNLEVKSRDLALVGVGVTAQEAARREQQRKRKEAPQEDAAENPFLEQDTTTHDVATPVIETVDAPNCEEDPDPKQWMTRYHIRFLVANRYPFLGTAGFVTATEDFRQEYMRRVKVDEEKAEEAWTESEVAVAWNSLFEAPFVDAHSSSSEDEFEVYRRPDSPPLLPEQPTEQVIAQALVSAAPALLVRKSKISPVAGVAQRCFEMFALGTVKNSLAIDHTAELEYRSNFLDRLFERTLSAEWLEWTCGKLANEVVIRERSSAASSPKHDGVGTISLGPTTTMDVVFLEVVGGVSNIDKLKNRKDSKKVFKAMSLATHVQHQMIVSPGYSAKKQASALQRIGAFGIVIAGRTLRTYAAKWIDGKVAIDQIGEQTIPSRMEDWGMLGNLIRHCLLLRERIGFLAGALKIVGRRNSAIPSPSVAMTPAPKRVKRT